MAKWGEGDPRWIVEERADATNVNNWHWTEKNATQWSEEKLKSLLKDLVIEDDAYSCEVTDLKNIDGSATINNRKAKLIFFYEWEIKADWQGQLKSDNTKYKGSFEVPNLSDENDVDDLDVQVSVKSTGDEAYKVKEFMRVRGAQVIKERLGEYMAALKKEYSQGVILPSSNSQSKNLNCLDKEKKPNEAKKAMNKPVVQKSSDVGVKLQVKQIHEKIEFKCTARELYDVLTREECVRGFCGGDVKLVPEKGGEFSLFGGNVRGRFTELVRNELIRQEWRFDSWPVGHHSEVKLEFKEKEDCTELTLTQTGVPDSDVDRTREGWSNYYWERIKRTFGYGSTLY